MKQKNRPYVFINLSPEMKLILSWDIPQVSKGDIPHIKRGHSAARMTPRVAVCPLTLILPEQRCVPLPIMLCHSLGKFFQLFIYQIVYRSFRICTVFLFLPRFCACQNFNALIHIPDGVNMEFTL